MKLEIKIKDDKAEVYSPFNPTFKDAVKRIGAARWNAEKKCWIVPASEVDFVRSKMIEVYGESDISAPDSVTVQLTAKEDLWELCGDVIFANKVLSHARGRDSGATTGDDVTIITGNVDSGGSVKNWRSEVEKGSVFRLQNVNPVILQKEIDSGEWDDCLEIEIIEAPKLNKFQLLKQKEELLAKIAEIDKMLQEAE